MESVARRFRSQVARRLSLELAVVLFLPILALAYFGLGQASRELERQARNHLDMAAKDASMSLIERVQACELDVEMLLGDLASAGTVPGSRGNLRLYKRLATNFRALGLHLPQGELEIVGSVPEMPVLSADEKAHVEKGLLTLVLREEDGLTRVLALRDLAAFGFGQGLLVGELELVALLPVEGTANLALLHESNLLHTTNPGVFTPGVLSAGADDGDGYLILESGQGRYVTARRNVFMRPQFGIVLTLLMGEPEAQALAPIQHFRTLFLLTALLAFLLVFFVGLKRIQKNLIPIGLLREATRRVAAGDLGSRLEIRTGDEFQGLGEAFNAMAEGVQERTQQLMEANAAKSRFLANMSHEIRTPMSSILGYTELCLAESGVAGEMRASLEVIRASGTHLLRVINDVLDVARIDAGKVQIERCASSPAAVLEQALRMVEPQVQAKGLAIESLVRGGLPARVTTDPDRLRQVLVNLLSNAAKFTQRGKITVTVELLSMGGSPRLAYEVTDTGPGMAPGQVQRLFQPFTQLDDSMSRQHGGTGLGLSIARAFARLLGGDLTCRSAVGEGSTFIATIDPCPFEAQVHPEPAAPLPAAAPPVQVSPSPLVLVVEDVDVNRKLLATHLKRGAFVVAEAENGRVAVDKVLAAWRAGAPFALVLMDMQMPVLDGYEATRILREQGYDGAIVALTAHAVGNEHERILASGCDDIATKPIDGARLLAVTHKSLRAPGPLPIGSVAPERSA